MPIKMNSAITRIEYRGNSDGQMVLKTLGRVVHLDRENDRFWVIPLPERCANRRDGQEDRVRRRHHIKRPWSGSISAYEGEEDKSYRFPELKRPEIMSKGDDELAANSTAGELRRTRRHLPSWLERRDATYALIKPIVVGAKIEELLDQTWVKQRCEERAAELKLKSTAKLVHAIRVYILWGRTKNALLPRFDRINEYGHEKLPRERKGEPWKKAGAMNLLQKSGLPDQAGVPMPARVRKLLHMGWKEFKVLGKASVRDAHLLTLWKHFPGSIDEDSQHVSWTPDEARLLPTLAQFNQHGPGKRADLSAERANLAPGYYEKNLRPRVGTSNDELLAAGFVATDSTSCDQNLVSVADPLQLLSSPWDTKVAESYTGYVAGWQCGFEHRSRHTSLMALANAASDKVEFCARYGVEIKPGDWISIPISGAKMDNGEGKGAEYIEVVSSSGISLEFVSPYRGDRNGAVETIHRSLALAGAHNIIGTTEGKRRTRPEADPADDAAINFGELMPILIRAILKYNNKDLVPHLLTMEMRRDNVTPTRACILKWMIAKGRVTSAPLDLTEIRTRCLPRLDATIEKGLIYLVDPTREHKSQRTRVKYLRYRPLLASGQSIPEYFKAKACQVLMNTSYLGEAWLHHDGLIKLELITNDEEIRRCSLAEWIAIARVAAVEEKLLGQAQALGDTVRLGDLHRICVQARQRRKQAEAEARARDELPSKKARKANRRENTDAERERHATAALGLTADSTAADPTPADVEPSPAPQAQPRTAPTVLDQQVSNALATYRAKRAAKK